MTQAPTSPSPSPSGATVVITHRVRPGQQPAYEAWLNEIGPLCRAAPGHLDWQIVRPIPGLGDTNTVIIRFDTIDRLKAWMDSPTRRELIERVQPLLVKRDEFHIRSGLDFWFVPEGAKAAVPVRWKQFLVTWSAIYPLVLAVTLMMSRAFALAGVTANHFVSTLLGTGCVVALMVYVVMPRYTHLVRRWLFA